MSQTNLCRLCVKILKDHKSIYKENGEGNEAYEWIYKYFHPMLLNHNETQHLKAICLECWNHLDNFHKFQTNVYEAHALLTAENEEDHIIKTEAEEIANLVGDAENMSLDYNAIDKIEEEFISLTAEETMPEAIELGRKTNVLENEFDLEESSKNSTNVETLTNASEPIDIEETMPEAIKLGRKTNVLENDCIWQESSENSTNVETLSKDNEPPIDIAVAEDDVNEENICENDTDDSSDYFDDIPLATLASAKKKIAGKKCLDFLNGSRTYSDATFDALLAKYMPNIKCVKCRKSFTNLSQLIEHFCKKHAKQKFYIICCNLQCEKLKKLKDHLLLHQDPNTFKCKLCGNSYTRKNGLRKHMYDKHKNSGTFKCNICNIVLSTPASLNLHLGKVHKRGQLEIAVADKQPVVKKLADGNILYACKLCKHVVSNLRTFRSHMFRKHCLNTKCDTCDRTFCDTRAMMEHKAIHTKTYLYACAFCSSKFRHIRTLYRHRQQQHPLESNRICYKRINNEENNPEAAPAMDVEVTT